MALTLPQGFVDLPAAKERLEQLVNIIGVVVDHMSPLKTKGGSDWVVTFTLRDPQWEKHPFMSGQGFGCRYFSDQSRLPQVSSNGDVVVLQKVRVIDWRNVIMLLSTRHTTWHILSACDISKRLPNFLPHFKALPNTLPLSKEQINYALRISDELDAPIVVSESSVPAKKLPSPTLDRAAQESHVKHTKTSTMQPNTRERFSLVQDIRMSPQKGSCFVDLVGEVRKVYSNGGRTELYISDYTSNKQLFEYSYGCDEDGREGDQFAYIHSARTNWPGPWGKLTLQVTAWDMQANFVSTKVKMGDFVLLQNVHVKLSPYKLMEGSLRNDTRFPDKVLVTILQTSRSYNDERLKELLKRRRDYEHKSKKQIQSDNPTSRQKRTLQDVEDDKEPENPRETEKPKDKKQKKKERKQRLLEQEKANAAKKDSNSHVVTNNINIPCTSLCDILNSEMLLATTPLGNDYHLPFHNCCYRTKVRIIDFLPDPLEDFCQVHIESDYDMLSSDSESDSEASSSPTLRNTNGTKKWEWRFALLVEDATGPPTSNKTQQKEHMILFVAQGDGDYLLNMEAEDLRQNPQTLARLREKLFVLWGDLEEQKREREQARQRGDDLATALSQKPLDVKSKTFECLVKEYGTKNKGSKEKDPCKVWERAFRLYGTRIM